MGNDSSFIDDLLNFSAPEKEQLENEDLQTPGSSSHRETRVWPTDSSGLINCDDDEVGEEEDLEWMTNKDAFPMIPLEHLGVLTEQFNLFPSEQLGEMSLTEEKQLSPVSVLETTSSSHGSTTTNTTSISSDPSTTVATTTTSLMNYCVGFKAPSKERSKRIRRGRSDMQVLWTSNGNEQGGVKKKMKTSSVVTPTVIIGRKCQHCGTEKTPQWRAGPMGAKTLCNACGVRYKSGRLYPEYRPVNSPTFTPELHSNSHRRVVEMRKKFESSDNDRKNCE